MFLQAKTNKLCILQKLYLQQIQKKYHYIRELGLYLEKVRTLESEQGNMFQIFHQNGSHQY